jgi:hypothetical protein
MPAAEIPAYVYLRRAKDVIDRRFAEPPDIPKLAREALASEAHFSPATTRATGSASRSAPPDGFAQPPGRTCGCVRGGI